MDPIILFFLLGLAAGLLKFELLLLSSGLKGGIELQKQPFLALAPDVLATLLIGLLMPLLAFPLLRSIGRFARTDAASI